MYSSAQHAWHCVQWFHCDVVVLLWNGEASESSSSSSRSQTNIKNSMNAECWNLDPFSTSLWFRPVFCMLLLLSLLNTTTYTQYTMTITNQCVFVIYIFFTFSEAMYITMDWSGQQQQRHQQQRVYVFRYFSHSSIWLLFKWKDIATSFISTQNPLNKHNL